jgi:PAS domain-containing protein
MLHAIRTKYRFTTVETSPVGLDGKRRYLLRSQWGIVEDGILRRIWGSNRDITELKLSEMALDAAERRMSELLEDLQLMVVILHPNGTDRLLQSSLVPAHGVAAVRCDRRELGRSDDPRRGSG